VAAVEISVLQLVLTFVGALLTGVISGFGGAYVAIRVLGKEVEWINKTLDKHDERFQLVDKSIDRLHARQNEHISRFHVEPNHRGRAE